MNKEDLINKLKERCASMSVDITKYTLGKVVDAYAHVIEDVLNKGGEIYLSKKIGKLFSVQSSERKCRNPRSGEQMVVPSKKRIKFKPSKTLLDAINQKGEVVN